ncbi:MAG TPA: sugar ABC transporter substrate-binding protein [Candidatus Methylomirabilis sp.]|nr:sugar ABC transporter substrate-binding protein [Candidatus Methylomirabilis sp.]
MSRRSIPILVLAVLMLSGSILPALAATELQFLSVARGEPRRQAILAAIADFEKANPGVKVALSEIPFDQYFQKAAIALSSGSGIDVFDVDSPLVASYGYQGALLPLDKYYTTENVDDFITAERTIATYRGKMISAPMGSTSVGLFVNVDLFKAAGLKIPSTDPKERMTWDQVVELAKKVQVDKSGNKIPDVWGLAIQQYDRPYMTLPLILSNGAGDLSPDGTTVDGFLNSPAAIEAARWYGDTFNRHKISPREQIPNLFYTGKLAMYLAPSYEANTLKSQYPKVNWIVAPHPFFKKPVTPTGAWHVGVFSGTKHPDFAVALLKAYTDPEAAKRNYRIMNYMPVRETTFRAFPETFTVAPNNLFYSEMVQTAIPRPRTPAYREYEDLLRQAFANIRQGSDASKEMNAAVEKINAQLRRYK